MTRVSDGQTGSQLLLAGDFAHWPDDECNGDVSTIVRSWPAEESHGDAGTSNGQ